MAVIDHFIYSNHLFHSTARWTQGALISLVLDKPAKQAIYDKSYGFPVAVAQWFQAYAEGYEKKCPIPVRWAQGTENQQKVWQTLQEIPYGSVITYGMLAEKAFGSKRYARVIGGICGKNPIPLVVPCHRVIGAGNTIGGYSAVAGISMKIALLKHEGVCLSAASA